jgi:hypothetical protein
VGGDWAWEVGGRAGWVRGWGRETGVKGGVCGLLCGVAAGGGLSEGGVIGWMLGRWGGGGVAGQGEVDLCWGGVVGYPRFCYFMGCFFCYMFLLYFRVWLYCFCQLFS